MDTDLTIQIVPSPHWWTDGFDLIVWRWHTGDYDHDRPEERRRFEEVLGDELEELVKNFTFRLNIFDKNYLRDRQPCVQYQYNGVWKNCALNPDHWWLYQGIWTLDQVLEGRRKHKRHVVVLKY
jgi:hypothetical protein